MEFINTYVSGSSNNNESYIFGIFRANEVELNLVVEYKFTKNASAIIGTGTTS